MYDERICETRERKCTDGVKRGKGEKRERECVIEKRVMKRRV